MHVIGAVKYTLLMTINDDDDVFVVWLGISKLAWPLARYGCLGACLGQPGLRRYSVVWSMPSCGYTNGSGLPGAWLRVWKSCMVLCERNPVPGQACKLILQHA